MLAVSRTDHDILNLLRIAKEFNITPTMVGGQEAYKVCEELVATKVPIILGPLSTNPAGTGPESSETVWNEPGLLHRAGIPFALSGGHLLDQALFAVRFGLPADVALDAITRTPAKPAGIPAVTGSTSAGIRGRFSFRVVTA